MESNLNRHNLFGLNIDEFGTEELENFINKSLNSNVTKVIYGYSLTVIPKFKEYPEIMDISNNFDLLTADGKGLFLFAKFNGIKLNEHLSLPDIAEFIVEYAAKKNKSVLLFGAKKEINSQACNNIIGNYPEISNIYGIDGYFSDSEEDALLDKIKSLKADIILIGITSPKKEKIAEKMKSKGIGGVIVPCGGMIDVFAGVTKREPQIIKKLALSWLYRFLQEPQRLWSAVFINGLKFIFVLFPVCLWKKYVIKDKTFTLKKYYKN